MADFHMDGKPARTVPKGATSGKARCLLNENGLFIIAIT